MYAKASTVYVMGRLLVILLIALVCVMEVFSEVKHRQKFYYITPFYDHFPEEESTSCQSDYNSSSLCSVLTLQELITRNKFLSPKNYEVFVVFQPGLHFINLSRSIKWFIGPTRNITFIGNDNATIYCLSTFGATFQSHTTISNIHFKNCCGNQGSTLLFRSHTRRNISISLENIKITHEICEGITVDFGNSKRDNIIRSFHLTNSTLTTGGNGLSIFFSGKEQKKGARIIKTSDVLFNGSCLNISVVQPKLKRNEIIMYCTIMSTTFVGCTCSPALSFMGLKKLKIKISDLTVNNTRSQHMMYINSTFGIITDKYHFHDNKGAVVITSSSKLKFHSATVEFVNNTIDDVVDDVVDVTGQGTFIVQRESAIVFSNSYIDFENNHKNLCGGIIAKEGTVLLFSNSTGKFTYNYGHQGGAISLYSKSVLRLKSDVHITFSCNKAEKGGAIFVDDVTYMTENQLYTLSPALEQIRPSVHLSFANNTALIGGNNIYGGWLDWTMKRRRILYTPSRLSSALKFLDNDPGIASDPIRMCVCINQHPNCSITSLERIIYPGQTITVPLVAVGQRNGPVVTHAAAEVVKNSSNPQSGKLKYLYQTLQEVRKTCKTLNYTVESPNSEETVRIAVHKDSEFKTSYNSYKYSLIPELNRHPFELQLLFNQFAIDIKFKDCPLIFTLDRTQYACICPQTLGYLGLRCDYNDFTIHKSEQQWIGVTYNHTAAESPGLIVHQHCPHDYCKKRSKVQLEHEYEVCAFNRSGMLCGSCQPNYSRVLGSSRCKQCSNTMLFVIIPSDLIAGLSLIVFLIMLNLTVSVGTINGLVFYANIVRAQHSIFFTQESAKSFLSKFIALLNLDQGIESCFYNGLDSYAETWLQFCFPLYIWLLVIAIIVSSHYSGRISKWIGTNAVQVLATLLLLSYTKILRLIIDVFSFATITYPDGYAKLVWLYDGSVDFLKGKHIPLFLTTLLLLVSLSFPYTLSLISIQLLLKISHFRVMFWVHRLKPLFDAYTGPFKAKHRYWPGLLLIVRIALLVIFSLNRSNDPAVNLFCIILFSIILFAWFYISGWIYESMLNNLLELAFLLNLTLTTVTILFQLYSSQTHSSAVIYASAGTAFVMFMAIILYHAQRRVRLIANGAKLMSKLIHHHKTDENVEDIQLQRRLELPQQVTYTVVELTQLLLEEEEEKV